MLTTTTGVISFEGLNLAVTLQPYLTIVSDPVTTVETFNSAMLCDLPQSWKAFVTLQLCYGEASPIYTRPLTQISIRVKILIQILIWIKLTRVSTCKWGYSDHIVTLVMAVS